MITITVNDVLRNYHNIMGLNDAKFCIYNVREEDINFYVGMSEDPLHRLSVHFTKPQGAGGYLGYFYRQYKQYSSLWLIDLYTLDDCKPYMPKTIILDRVREAETAMIGHLRPCLNKSMNRNPTPLPEKYRF